ncbi:hypothetical protein GCM10009114_34120 [Aliiglaciecola litoralis]|uniref:Uncharacterized protein n=1 Tax=Aliiglaciecola litoralis TaxID=582857 RepID=A0ABN1LSA2_9ALTE
MAAKKASCDWIEEGAENAQGQHTKNNSVVSGTRYVGIVIIILSVTVN